MKISTQIHLFGAVLIACHFARPAFAADLTSAAEATPVSVEGSTNAIEVPADEATTSQIASNATETATTSTASSGDSTNAVAPAALPPLTVSVVNETLKNMPQASRAYVTVGESKFAFLTPAGFRVQSSSRNSLSLVGPDYNGFITLSIVGAMPSETTELNPAIFRRLLFAKYPGAKIIEEFSLSAADQSGPAFDLKWENSRGTIQRARVAYIPSAAGILEFTLLTSEARFSELQFDFNTLLVTFRASVDGRLEVPALSDKM